MRLSVVGCKLSVVGYQVLELGPSLRRRANLHVIPSVVEGPGGAGGGMIVPPDRPDPSTHARDDTWDSGTTRHPDHRQSSTDKPDYRLPRQPDNPTTRQPDNPITTLQVAPSRLLALDRLEQRLEVALAESASALALDDLEEHRRPVLHGLGEDLQQVPVLVAIDEDAQV